ncbi:MAG: hypothetical protein ABSD68_00885 [Candidatus Micrarchaeales archaeon]
MQKGDEMEIVPEFARKKSASDEIEYAVDVAEDKDLVYLIENTCMCCNRLMKKDEIRVLPPKYIQERDPYVNNNIVRRRMMCVSCYNTLRSTARERVRFHGLGRSLFGKHQETNKLLANG